MHCHHLLLFLFFLLASVSGYHHFYFHIAGYLTHYCRLWKIHQTYKKLATVTNAANLSAGRTLSPKPKISKLAGLFSTLIDREAGNPSTGLFGNFIWEERDRRYNRDHNAIQSICDPQSKIFCTSCVGFNHLFCFRSTFLKSLICILWSRNKPEDLLLNLDLLFKTGNLVISWYCLGGIAFY